MHENLEPTSYPNSRISFNFMNKRSYFFARVYFAITHPRHYFITPKQAQLLLIFPFLSRHSQFTATRSSTNEIRFWQVGGFGVRKISCQSRILEFKQGRTPILLATDVAARGLGKRTQFLS